MKIVLGIIAILISSCSLDSFKNVNFEQNQLDSFVIDNNINLKVGIKIPDGIEPIVFNSIKERNIFIINQRHLLKSNTKILFENNSNAGNTGGCTDLNGSYRQTVGVFLSSYASNTYYSYCDNEFVGVNNILVL